MLLPGLNLALFTYDLRARTMGCTISREEYRLQYLNREAIIDAEYERAQKRSRAQKRRR